MSILAKRALAAVLTVIGIVLLGLGSWFTVHLGPSGSATFTGTPDKDSIVIVEPSLLNRVDRPTTVTVTTRDDGPVFLGRTTPSDARALVGGAAATTVTGARVPSWSLVQSRSGAGSAPSLAGADVWRGTVEGKGTVRLRVSQENAPEAVVVATADGKPADLLKVSVTIERRTWFFQALLVALVGLLVTAAGVAGGWRGRGSRRPAPAAGSPDQSSGAAQDTPTTTDPDRPDEEVTA